MESVKIINSGRKISVEYVATVNKVPYYVSVSNPDLVFTEHEIWRNHNRTKKFW